MLLCIDDLKHLDDVGVSQCGPELYLVIHFVEAVNHLHLALAGVSDGPLLHQHRLMHHFHRKQIFLLPECISTSSLVA